MGSYNIVGSIMTGESMSVQTVKLAGMKFVIVSEKDYRDLKAKAEGGGRLRRSSVKDRIDIAHAKRREHEPTLPYSRLRKELGLS